MIKQLEAGMAELMKGGAGPGDSAPTAGKESSKGSGGGDDSWNALADELSQSGMQPADLMKLMLGEDVASGLAGDGGGGSGSAGKEEDNQEPATSGKKPAAAPSGENFQDTIQKTMERMQQSGDKATVAANEGEGEGDEMLMQVLKAMEASGVNPEGEGGDENMDKVFMGIMEQLSNKEMLYEPMKELHDKFGPWLKENKDKVSKEDLERYELQSTLVAEIVGKFEEEGFSDDNPEHRAYVWERMQKVCAVILFSVSFIRPTQADHACCIRCKLLEARRTTLCPILLVMRANSRKPWAATVQGVPSNKNLCANIIACILFFIVHRDFSSIPLLVYVNSHGGNSYYQGLKQLQKTVNSFTDDII